MLCGLAAMTLMAVPVPAWSWQTAHGKPDNSGAVDVPTVPAAAALPNAPRLGGVAAGAGPVIAPDGTVYVVNGRGKLMSFAPDGTPGWSREIGGFQGVLSSPALGSDGSIYVVGAAVIRDKTVDPPTTKRIAELHKFTAGGGYVWHVPLPGAAGGLITSAPPNILRTGGGDVILVPTVFNPGNYQARLSAFSETGALVADQIVTSFSPETTGGSGGISGWNIPCYVVTLGHYGCQGGFGAPQVNVDSVHLLPEKTRPPIPAVAVFTPNGNGAPLVMMSDALRDLVGLSLTGNAFQERFRVHVDAGKFYGAPLAWPDGHAMITLGHRDAASEVLFAGFNMSTIRAAGPTTWAPPTALGNSRYAMVRRHGGVTVLQGVSHEISVTLPGESIASAAASRDHLFVSTASALHTFDKKTMTELAKFDWRRGGASPVAIGPQGHVYAIADDQLFVFPPTVTLADGPVIDKPGGGVLQDQGMPNPAPTTPQAKSYKPPLTTAGNRLFACEKLDGDDCGKGDYRAIAATFCAKSGYAKAPQFDVDSKKVKAETLDGRYCSKKKCKVFEEIVCAM